MKMGLLLLAMLMMAGLAQGQECEGALQIHFFYSMTCPHCAHEKPLLERIDSKCDAIDVSFYVAADSQEKWREFSDKYNTSMGGVPMTYIGDYAFVGYTKEDGPLERDPVSNAYIGYRNQILKAIEENVPGCGVEKLLEDEPNSRASPLWVLLLLVFYPFTWLFFRGKLKDSQNRRFWFAGLFATLILCIFYAIAVTPETVIKDIAASLPFPLFVFIIALADGFNPCAFTVLIILLSLLTITKRRRDMLIVGGIFIATSAVMYFIFIATMILVGSWAIDRWGHVIITSLGVIITLAGIINLKDLFFFKKGPSLGISDKHKSRIFNKASKIARDLRESRDNPRILLIAIGATVMLAVFVNLVELGCTAILPTVFMAGLVNTLGAQMSTMHAAWTAFYSAVYILPLLAILINFVYAFKSARLTEEQGRILKLVAGLFMLLFGMIMLLNPSLLMFG